MGYFVASALLNQPKQLNHNYHKDITLYRSPPLCIMPAIQHFSVVFITFKVKIQFLFVNKMKCRNIINKKINKI
jgi:hypothetical protein